MHQSLILAKFLLKILMLRLILCCHYNLQKIQEFIALIMEFQLISLKIC